MTASRRSIALAILFLLIASDAFADNKLTPSEREFVKAFIDNVGRIWYANSQANKERLSFGTVSLRISISSKGKLTEVRVLSNTSDRLAAQLGIDAIRRAKIPSMPPEADHGWSYSTDFSFTIYDNGPNHALQPTASRR